MILFVGDSPSKLMKPNTPAFSGAACEKRLNTWIEYIGNEPYYLVNSVSKEDILLINLWIQIGNPVIALGNIASKRLKKAKHFKLPHPSGRNRQINDKTFIKSQLDAAKKYLDTFSKV